MNAVKPDPYVRYGHKLRGQSLSTTELSLKRLKVFCNLKSVLGPTNLSEVEIFPLYLHLH